LTPVYQFALLHPYSMKSCSYAKTIGYHDTALISKWNQYFSQLLWSNRVLKLRQLKTDTASLCTATHRQLDHQHEQVSFFDVRPIPYLEARADLQKGRLEIFAIRKQSPWTFSSWLVMAMIRHKAAWAT